jgi:hypothetical protein
MADLNSSIENIVQGDDCYVIRDIENIPAGQQLTDAWLSVKENHWDTAAIIEKHITTVSSADGHIVDSGMSDTIGLLQFRLESTDTADLHEFYQYVFDIQVKTSGGSGTSIFTPESGVLTVYPSITAAV